VKVHNPKPCLLFKEQSTGKSRKTSGTKILFQIELHLNANLSRDKLNNSGLETLVPKHVIVK
jgi:hypothetical protein